MTQRFSLAVLLETPTSCRLLPPRPPPLATHARPRPGPFSCAAADAAATRSDAPEASAACTVRAPHSHRTQPPRTRHGAGRPPPPPHPPARLRRDAKPPPQQGKPAGPPAGPRLLSVRLRPFPGVPAAQSRPFACVPRRCPPSGPGPRACGATSGPWCRRNEGGRPLECVRSGV